MISRQFLAFVVAGGLAACANFGSRILLSLVLPYVAAIVIAYLIGMLTAFVLNRLLVFTEAKNELKHQAFWFTVVNLAAVAQTIVISLLFARWLFPAVGMDFHPETIAHGIGVAVPVLTSYLGHKRFTFRSTP
ncbi:GtrA family protein [Lysobacter sp. BMK333-48F3]|uniref:GtrA family protein n=1 Tax=Lysobacter sp. BMK333-48F3 TaxID=2867962 RepID=UPI001C8C627C|nr:GtrA family protein [Lysobacter sp. BMK333-48F3]MBX9400129.1 GtrA family protein [Lysobacter sp. BMK333-48F3]